MFRAPARVTNHESFHHFAVLRYHVTYTQHAVIRSGHRTIADASTARIFAASTHFFDSGFILQKIPRYASVAKLRAAVASELASSAHTPFAD